MKNRYIFIQTIKCDKSLVQARYYLAVSVQLISRTQCPGRDLDTVKSELKKYITVML